MSDTKYLDTFLNLKIISKLRAHDRLDTSQPVFKIHSATYLIPLWVIRWWTRGSREHDVSRIETLFNDAAEILNSDTDEGRKSQIADAMEQALNGLRNLCRTYESDATIQSRVEVVIDNAERTICTEE